MCSVQLDALTLAEVLSFPYAIFDACCCTLQMEVASNYGRGSCQQHRRKLRHSTEDPVLAQAAAYSSTTATGSAAAASAGTAAAAAIDVDSDDEDAAVNDANADDNDDSDGEGDAPDSADVALDRDEELLITSTFLYLMSKVRESSRVLVVFNLCTAYSAFNVAVAAL
jgi:hypothetical protein